MKIWLTIIITFGLAYAGQADVKKKDIKVRDFFKDKTDIPSPLSLRDPFKKPRKRQDSRKTISVVTREGTATNVLDTTRIEPNEISIEGIYVGKNRRAIARAGGESFLLKEGMKFGKSQEAEVKAILPGGVVIVEKIVNIYDQVEYLETIIPISK